MAAQQTSLRVSPTEPLTSESSWGPDRRYDDTEAAPISPAAASVTTRTPARVNSKPYGVAPEDGNTVGPSAEPSGATAYALMLSVARSVTTSVPPSGLNPIWAGSASGRLSSRPDPANGETRPSSLIMKPCRVAGSSPPPFDSTYSRFRCTAMLVGLTPPAPTRSTSVSPSVLAAKTDNSSLPALTANNQRPSPLRTTEPWEARCGVPVPSPPVSYAPSGVSVPSPARR
jgi:hypothetical protein